MDGITDSMDMSLCNLWEMVKNREAWHDAVHGVIMSWTQLSHRFRSVQLFSHVLLFATPGTAACQVSLSIINSQSLLKLMSIELVMTSINLSLCHPLLLLLSIFPSIRVFSNESALCIRWPKYCSMRPSNEYSEMIFRMDWFEPLQSKGLPRVFSSTTD